MVVTCLSTRILNLDPIDRKVLDGTALGTDYELLTALISEIGERAVTIEADCDAIYAVDGNQSHWWQSDAKDVFRPMEVEEGVNEVTPCAHTRGAPPVH